jgi:hypothetical protein
MDYSQPGVYNVLDYGMSPGASGSYNAAALQAAIDDAQNSLNSIGAIVLIPSFDGASPPNYGAYQIEIPYGAPAAITIPGTGYGANSLLICGTGSGTTLEVVGAGTLFSVDGSHGNPVTFQDLTITALKSGGEVSDSVTAIHFVDGDFSSCFRVNVIDCEFAFIIQSYATTLLQCSITYDAAYSSELGCTGIWVRAGATQVNIEQCLLTCASLNEDTIGIQVDFSDWTRVCDTQVSGFYTGISFNNTGSGTTRGPVFAGLEVDATGSCVLMNPGDTNGVYDVSFVNCHFEPTPATSAPNGSGIVLSPGSLDNAGIDTVSFTSCAVVGYPAPYYGLEISGGQNIQVTGGDYSGNGGGGIAILGAATEIQITGANCVGLSYAGAATATTQMYGIYATAGQDIQIVGVNCSGNGTSSEAQGAGIYLDPETTNSLVDVRIVGAICSGPTLGGMTSVQQYGIYANFVSGLLIDGCTLTNNTGYGAYLNAVENATVTACDVYSNTSGSKGIAVLGPTDLQAARYVFIRNCNGAQYSPNWADVVDVSGSYVSFVEVTNCAGYNDVGAQLATSAPTGTFSAVSVAGYYGPAAFYLVAPSGTTVYIDGYDTNLSQGGFTLATGETATISGFPTHFLMVGK